jgi:4-phytase/acid phosphatase
MPRPFTRACAFALTCLFMIGPEPTRAQVRFGHGGGHAPHRLMLERVVMLMRHGVRAPLADEAAAGLAVQPWPVWSTPGGSLTPHGQAGVRLLGAYDRARFAAAGLLPETGCAPPGAITIWTNSVERTIASGEAFSDGLAPGCGVTVDHLPLGQPDPLFAWPGPELAGFDARAAAAAINAQTGGAAKIAAASRPALHTLETIVGCDAPLPSTGVAHACDLAAAPGAITVSPDGKGLDVSGPIRIASGAAQVLMLEYLEGLPMDEVGWGRATLAQLTEISRLHALLFEVYSRPAYIAPKVAGPLARRLLALIDGAAPSPAVAVIVGHDDNIAAVTALLETHFQLPGYGDDDPPVGGALMFEVYRDIDRGERYVRLVYEAQTPDQLRDLAPLNLDHPPALQTLPLPLCARRSPDICRLGDFRAALTRKLSS